MQLEAIQQWGAEPSERSDGRTAQRNEHKKRSLKTRVAELILEKPQFRDQSFKSCIFDNYSRVELALTNAIAESYLQGVSTRRIREVVSHLGVERLSASTVSRIAKELDEKISEFHHYPCRPRAKEMSPSNVIWFINSEDAQDQGYVPCDMCCPPTESATMICRP